jgi:putative uncharacterized protein GLEAN_08474
MYIFGGYNQDLDLFFSNVFRFDVETLEWTCLYNLESEWCSRNFLSSVLIKNNIYLFGGQETKSNKHDNRVFCLNLDSMNWSIASAKGTIPCGRRSHCAFVHNNKMIIYGGYNKLIDKYFNDFYSFDPETQKWTEILVQGLPTDSHRKRPSGCVVNDRLFIFGGSW